MALFTFVIEFRGSTMICQVKAASPRTALKRVTAKLDGLDARSMLELSRALSEDTATEVDKRLVLLGIRWPKSGASTFREDG